MSINGSSALAAPVKALAFTMAMEVQNAPLAKGLERKDFHHYKGIKK